MSDKYDCQPCENLNLAVEHTLFLGASFITANASVGWNADASTLSVALVEDTCPGNKKCYNECMQEVDWSGADPGFFGENRWQRADGSQYSKGVSLLADDPTDTLVFSGQDLVGRPGYFRVGDFEWCGIIQDWTKEEGCEGSIYHVQLQDPRHILEGVFLITGQYSGCVSQYISVGAGGTGCPEANVFNVYGYMEQFGCPCPPVGQCGEYNYQIIAQDGAGQLLCPSGLPIDGTIFGTPLGGFGGSYGNEDGMPWGYVQLGFNLLANSTPANQNCFSPYGRVCFCGSEIPLENSGCGLMAPDIDPDTSGVDPCLVGKDYYYVDLSHLDAFISPNYRIPGPVISVADLLNQLSQDFNFDYFVDLVPFVEGSGSGCAIKTIKVYAVNRNVRPDTSAISQFIEANDCLTKKTLGKELRNETTSKFLIGGKKRFIYQIDDDTNPDGGTTCEMTSLDSSLCAERTETYTPRETASVTVDDPCSPNPIIGWSSAATLQPFSVDITAATNFNLLPVDGYPTITGTDWTDFLVNLTGAGITVQVENGIIIFEDMKAWAFEYEYAATTQFRGVSNTPIRSSQFDQTDVSGYPYIDGSTCCSGYDDVIVPYWGLDYNEDILVSCKDSNGNWFFDAPVAEISAALMEGNFGGLTHVRIGEEELRAALEGFTHWMSFVWHAGTESVRIFNGQAPPKDIVPLLQPLLNGEFILPRDVSNPSVRKFKGSDDGSAKRFEDDLQKVYEWISNYAKNYYGRQFAVRVPFTCCWWDAENQQVRISEKPSNAGGWTEESTVLGLTNQDPNREGYFDFLNFFRDDMGRVECFVRYDQGILKSISNLNQDDYLVYYEIDSSDLSSVTVDDGPPSGSPVPSDPAVYFDQITGLVWVWDFGESDWKKITDACIYQNYGVPSGVRIPADCFGVYLDLSTYQLYVNLDSTPSSDGSDLYSSSWIPINFYLYVKAQVQEDYVFHDKEDYWSPRVVITVPQSINLREEDPQYNRGIVENISKLFNRSGCSGDPQIDNLADAVNRVHKNGVSTDSWLRIYERACIPNAVAIPMESNNITYGPWYNPAEGCGRTDVEQDNSLVPWNFGSYATMNTAAQFLVDNARADMKVGEMGQVCLPGYPTLPLGAELGAVDGGYYGGGSYLVENRSLDELNFSGTNGLGDLVELTYSVWQQPVVWTGLYGPNITNIQISADCPPSTCYSMRTFAPPSNEGRAKWTLNQIQKFRDAVAHESREIKRLIDQNEKLRFARSFFSESDRRREPQGEIQKDKGNNAIIQGQLVPWQTQNSGADFRRPSVGSITTDHMSEEIQHSYDKKAFMSMDGFYRPVSMDGDGGLPRYIQYTGSEGITLDDLQPIQNPSGFERSKVAVERSDTPNVGHDIEIVGRNGYGQGSLSIDGYSLPNDGDYSDDARFVALKGPIIIQSWGYDCQGYPVPNKVDTESNASSGIFASSGLDEDKFLDGHLRKSHTWAVAPLDLRLDKETGTWKTVSCCTEQPHCMVAEDCADHSGNIGEATGPEGTINFTNNTCRIIEEGDRVLIGNDCSEGNVAIWSQAGLTVHLFSSEDCFPIDSTGVVAKRYEDASFINKLSADVVIDVEGNPLFHGLLDNQAFFAARLQDDGDYDTECDSSTRYFFLGELDPAESITFETQEVFRKSDGDWFTLAKSISEHASYAPSGQDIIVTLPGCFSQTYVQSLTPGTCGLAGFRFVDSVLTDINVSGNPDPEGESQCILNYKIVELEGSGGGGGSGCSDTIVQFTNQSACGTGGTISGLVSGAGSVSIDVSELCNCNLYPAGGCGTAFRDCRTGNYTAIDLESYAEVIQFTFTGADVSTSGVSVTPNCSAGGVAPNIPVRVVFNCTDGIEGSGADPDSFQEYSCYSGMGVLSCSQSSCSELVYCGTLSSETCEDEIVKFTSVDDCTPSASGSIEASIEGQEGTVQVDISNICACNDIIPTQACGTALKKCSSNTYTALTIESYANVIRFSAPEITSQTINNAGVECYSGGREPDVSVTVQLGCPVGSGSEGCYPSGADTCYGGLAILDCEQSSCNNLVYCGIIDPLSSSAAASGISTEVDVVTNVFCSGTSFYQVTESLTFQCGLLVGSTPGEVQELCDFCDCSGSGQDCNGPYCEGVCEETYDITFNTEFGGDCTCLNGLMIQVENVGDCMWIQNNVVEGETCCSDVQELQETYGILNCADCDGIDPPGSLNCVECSGDDCIEECNQGLCSYSASVQCIGEEWVLTVNIGTNGICPKIELEGVGALPNENGCPPPGPYSLSWTESYDCIFECDNLPTEANLA